MKKTIIAILVALSLLIMPSAKAARVTEVPEVTDHEKVNIYVFWASWCSHCHDFMEYFSDKYADYSDYFEIVTFQVDDGNGGRNTVNSTLMATFGELLDNPNGSIPFIIIGDWKQTGFGSNGVGIIEKALEAYQNKDYKDVVAETISKNSLEMDAQPISKALVAAGIAEGENTNEKEESDDTLVIVIVFAVIILGFGGLFLYSRKK